MLLLRAARPLSAAAARVYHRLTLAGGLVPRTGPVLLVANHPNSIMDPVLVTAAARRSVRFLAKAPLFEQWLFGRILRSAGTIPVFRKGDDPTQMNRNEAMFRTVFEALGDGSLVGIFPEGITHTKPSITSLKTGAARIALGATDATGGWFPIVPIGLLFQQKDVFRSEATAIVGDPIDWSDLAERGEDDVDAVLDLTNRIDAGIRTVTLNLERWEDQPIVECAEAGLGGRARA